MYLCPDDFCATFRCRFHRTLFPPCQLVPTLWLPPWFIPNTIYLIFPQHHLPPSLEINLLCTICQKFCHSISGFLAHWSLGFVCNFHSAQLETKKCNFSKTCEGEKRRRANDCYLGVSLISQWSALFNGSAQTILSPNISKFKFLPPYYRQWPVWCSPSMGLVFLPFWAPFTNYQLV